jgi:hypothetical protein
MLDAYTYFAASQGVFIDGRMMYSPVVDALNISEGADSTESPLHLSFDHMTEHVAKK